jgi:hypothetical protein
MGVARLICRDRWAENIEMKVPVTVVGFGMVIIGRIFLGLLRASYLKQSSEGVSIDYSKEIVLKYALWYYLFPIGCFGLSAMFGLGVLYGSPHPEAILIYNIACVFCFLGGVFLLYRQLTARVTIFGGKFTYTEGGDRWEFLADDVSEVSLNGFAFLVRLKWQKTVKVPATFQHSEIILAFLNQAAKTHN